MSRPLNDPRCLELPHPMPRQAGEGFEQYVERYLKDQRANLDSFVRQVCGRVCPGANSATIEELSGLIETPTAKAYTIIESCKYASFLDNITFRLTAGTCTVSVSIDGIAVPDLAAVDLTAAQLFVELGQPANLPKGARLEFTVSNITGAANLSFTVRTTRKTVLA